MTPKGSNISIRVRPREKVTKSGIIIPDMVTPDSQEWGEVVDVDDTPLDIKSGERVLYIGKKAFEQDGVKIIPQNRLLIWGV